MKAITTQAGIAVPLPKLASCPECGDEVKIRADGNLPKHDRRPDPKDSIRYDSSGYVVARCSGSERLAGEPLEPTFAR